MITPDSGQPGDDNRAPHGMILDINPVQTDGELSIPDTSRYHKPKNKERKIKLPNRIKILLLLIIVLVHESNTTSYDFFPHSTTIAALEEALGSYQAGLQEALHAEQILAGQGFPYFQDLYDHYGFYQSMNAQELVSAARDLTPQERLEFSYRLLWEHILPTYQDFHVNRLTSSSATNNRFGQLSNFVFTDQDTNARYVNVNDVLQAENPAYQLEIVIEATFQKNESEMSKLLVELMQAITQNDTTTAEAVGQQFIILQAKSSALRDLFSELHYIKPSSDLSTYLQRYEQIIGTSSEMVPIDLLLNTYSGDFSFIDQVVVDVNQQIIEILRELQQGASNRATTALAARDASYDPSNTESLLRMMSSNTEWANYLGSTILRLERADSLEDFEQIYRQIKNIFADYDSNPAYKTNLIVSMQINLQSIQYYLEQARLAEAENNQAGLESILSLLRNLLLLIVGALILEIISSLKHFSGSSSRRGQHQVSLLMKIGNNLAGIGREKPFSRTRPEVRAKRLANSIQKSFNSLGFDSKNIDEVVNILRESNDKKHKRFLILIGNLRRLIDEGEAPGFQPDDSLQRLFIAQDRLRDSDHQPDADISQPHQQEATLS